MYTRVELGKYATEFKYTSPKSATSRVKRESEKWVRASATVSGASLLMQVRDSRSFVRRGVRWNGDR